MERKLASIQKVEKLSPIEGADNIEQATILGWTVVVKKGDFKKNDLCIFCEIDSVLPQDQEWAKFMEARKFRVKTIRLRGCLSQGLALPISILPRADEHDPRFEVGDDVTSLLGVVKYEPEVHAGMLAGDSAGTFIPGVPKTDEMRLQSVLGVLEEIKGVPVQITTKLDGTSATYGKLDGKFYVCSRNFEKKDGDNVYWNIARTYNIEKFLPEGFAIQGEIVGEGIQKNRLGIKGIDFFVFSVYNIERREFLDAVGTRIMATSMGLKNVPLEMEGILPESFWTLDNLLEKAKGFYPGTKNRKEGIVIRPLKETYSKALRGRLSFKVINNDFLLKEEE